MTRSRNALTAEALFSRWWGVRQGASLAERRAAEVAFQAAYVAVLMEQGRSEGRILNEVAAVLIDTEPDLEPAVEEWFTQYPVTV